MIRFCHLLLLIICCGGQPLLSQDAAAIFQKYRNKICRVQFYKNVSSQAQIGSYIKIEQHRVGVQVSPDGLVMVNSDVYPLSLDILSGDGVSFFSGEPTDFRVFLPDGSDYPAEFVGKDDLSQTAFIRVTEKLPAPLPYVQFTPTADLQTGQRIYLLELLGEKYDFQPLFSEYTISAIITRPRRKILVKDGDIALSAGGLVIAANSLAVGVSLRRNFEDGFHEGMGFEGFGKNFMEIAPSEWLNPLIEHPPILETAFYRGKAWFGVGMQALTPELKTYWHVPAQGGVVIDRVFPDSPAEKAGLRVRDVIISLGGQLVEVQRDEELGRFREMVTRQPLDQPVTISIFRNGKKTNQTVTFTSAPRSVDVSEKYLLADIGVEVRELTRDILFDFNLPLNTRGVYVFQVDRAAPAGLGGLETGSIITAVNGETVENLADFRQRLERLKTSNIAKLIFQTQFRRETQFVFVDTE